MSFKVCRLKAGIKTSKEAAEKLGITIEYLSGIENGKRRPSFSLIEKMATLYGTTIDNLVGREIA